MPPTDTPAGPHGAGARWPRRAALWGVLVALLLVAQGLLITLTVEYESSRQQERADAAAAAVADELRQTLARDLQSLQGLLWNEPSVEQWTRDAAELLRQRRALLRLERRDAAAEVVHAVESPYGTSLASVLPRSSMEVETELACTAAQRLGAASYSRSYFVPLGGGFGLEVMDLCMPVQQRGRVVGFVTASFGLAALLEEALRADAARAHELSVVEGDGTRLARAGARRGAGVSVAERLLDLPGHSLRVRADGVEGRPRLIPNLATGLVLGLSIALFALVLMLARDVRRRARAEAALAEALAFRKAMEDSLVTGLRARDLDGRVTYANPAFCSMVGFGIDELRAADTPPYWPPERVDTYAERQRVRLAGEAPPREGFETVFMRKSGERFPVMIYEAPLVDGSGRQTGWMSAVLDLSAQRRVEELARAQQDRLQASARLATVGEMASLLSHELNQPLAAIASYASGSLNLLDEADAAPAHTQAHAHADEHAHAHAHAHADADADTHSRADVQPHASRAAADDRSLRPLLRQALSRIAEQAERAGRVIHSVHAFVRRRERAREALSAAQLVESVLPLVRLQARKSGTRIELDIATPAPRVVCDRTLVEQVLLNLTRNGLQAMETATPLEHRVLTLRVRRSHPRWVTFSVADAGSGIEPEVARRLFTPFFTTREEGMGLGLALCRSVIEQHGGALDFETRPAGPDGTGGGTEFRFTLPADTPENRTP